MVKALLHLGLLLMWALDKLGEKLFGSAEWTCSHGRVSDLREAYIPGYHWMVSQDTETGDRNVMPLGDKEEHARATSCKCSPRVDVEGARLVIIHNAFDHREIAEEAVRVINEVNNGEAE